MKFSRKIKSWASWESTRLQKFRKRNHVLAHAHSLMMSKWTLTVCVPNPLRQVSQHILTSLKLSNQKSLSRQLFLLKFQFMLDESMLEKTINGIEFFCKPKSYKFLTNLILWILFMPRYSLMFVRFPFFFVQETSKLLQNPRQFVCIRHFISSIKAQQEKNFPLSITVRNLLIAFMLLTGFRSHWRFIKKNQF